MCSLQPETNLNEQLQDTVVEICRSTSIRFRISLSATIAKLFSVVEAPLASILQGQEVRTCSSIHSTALSRFDVGMTLSQMIECLGDTVRSAVVHDHILEMDVSPPPPSIPAPVSDSLDARSSSVELDPVVEFFSNFDCFCQLVQNLGSRWQPTTAELIYCTADVGCLATVCKLTLLYTKSYLVNLVNPASGVVSRRLSSPILAAADNDRIDQALGFLTDRGV